MIDADAIALQVSNARIFIYDRHRFEFILYKFSILINWSNIMTNNINNQIFREYDIRGIYNETLFDIDAYNIGRAFASIISIDHNNIITVMRDGRNSSPSLSAALIQGIIDSGVDVINLEVGPTPLLYFSNYVIDKVIAGIMITGSHNPIDHNGFKFIYNRKPFFGKDIKLIEETIIKNKFNINKSKVIEYNNSKLTELYLNKLNNDYKQNRKLKIAWDPSNGATCDIIDKLCSILPGDHIIINKEIDGNFPNHHPDPTILDNMKQLIDVVVNNNCDIGIGFDGDGDRIGVIDDKGCMISGDQLISIFINNILENNKDSTIIADVKSSNMVFDLITELGGKSIMWKTGHSLIKSKMIETNAIFAGEMSGHIFFNDKYYGYDDGIYSAIRIIDILSNSDIKLNEMINQLPKTFSTKEYRIDCDDDKKFELVDNVKNIVINHNIDFIDIDGVRARFEYGWWLIRASNTQNAIIVRCEANSGENLERIKSNLSNILNTIGIKIDW
jgi:phosphomannomutase